MSSASCSPQRTTVRWPTKSSSMSKETPSAFSLSVRTPRAVVRCGEHDEVVIPLRDGLSVAEFYAAMRAALGSLSIAVPILAKPYGIPGENTPFADDREHHTYDQALVSDWWTITRWTADVFERFASEFAGKQGPVQLFWHSFDLALGRYSG